MRINADETLNDLGGKGYNLNRLKSFCLVPEYFVINFTDIKEIENKEVQKEIRRYFKENHYKLVSVRSSATLEDSNSASFAGLFDSILNVKEDNLIEAIRKVLTSSRGVRVKEYCVAKNLDYESIKMRVIVQKMVQSRVSGVCFTRTQNSKNLMMIEACLGLGEALVSGQVTPDKYLIDKTTLKIDDSAIGYQNKIVKNTEYEILLTPNRKRKKLTNEEILKIAKISLEIEEMLNLKGADIEWAIEKDQIYILQARAITFDSIEEKEVLPTIDNYELTFKVTGLNFLFADLLCRGFGYLHPLFICHNNYFLQYFTNEKMQYATQYGYDWLSDKLGFDEYKKEFEAFHKISYKKLNAILKEEMTIKNRESFFEIIYNYFIFYSKMDYQFTNTTYLAAKDNKIIEENMKKLSAFKDIARTWINAVATDENCLLNKFIDNLSKEYNVDSNIINLYKIEELINLTKENKVDLERIKEREMASIVLYDGFDIKYICGKKALCYKKEVQEKEKQATSNSLRGQVANKGDKREIRGKVRIINIDYSDFNITQKAIKEMEKGEILVSESTAPELIDACTKAKAIITEMGGMLSHAAIISRELNIPCVVGTRYASSYLKDGDEIKIDLETGIITKID